uniref:Uncharacterized protein n=1 Tax=Leptocylindrus danicus TaxID=163516 RepID=A0A7S2KGP4_9STRA|mmetsp:Transcript_22129/g.33213  ORF Transcript_22129/g.33213 Transcript_22129/m.33213 type:complete len:206 (+) Transcript_22129:103-720(+)
MQYYILSISGKQMIPLKTMIRLAVCSLAVADAFVLQSAHMNTQKAQIITPTQYVNKTGRRRCTKNTARCAYIPDYNDMQLLLADSSTQLMTNNDDHTTDIAVFIAGIIPFAWATVEFWRRIAVGASFGTGADSVVIDPNLEVVTIGEDGAPLSSRGRRVLGKGALAAAYLLFGIAIAVLGLTAVSVLSAPTESMDAVLSGGAGNN